jgi:hypothetical protein
MGNVKRLANTCRNGELSLGICQGTSVGTFYSNRYPYQGHIFIAGGNVSGNGSFLRMKRRAEKQQSNGEQHKRTKSFHNNRFSFKVNQIFSLSVYSLTVLVFE